MNSLGRTLLSFALVFSCCSIASAQEQSSSSIPKVLQITREYTKPGKAGAVHEKAESAFVQAMARAKWPTHYMALTSLTGKQRALFLTRYDSFEAWEKDNAAVAKNASLASSIDRAGFNDGDLLDSLDQAVFYFRESMSLRPMADISKMRYLDVMAFKIRGGKGREWEELVKLAKEGYGKGDPEAHWGVFELVYGGDSGTYLVLTARKSLSEVDRGFAMEKQMSSAIGEANGKKMDDLFASCVESLQTQLFAFNPAMSYPAEEWIKSDPDFWKPKATTAMTMPKKPAMEDVQAKP
jgi:hypothetical protein